VIVPAILGGELTVHYKEGVARSIEPTAIRVAAKTDAALVKVELPPEASRMAREEWALDSAPTLRVGQRVIAAGAPGEWKSDPDVVRRVVLSARTLLFWTAITNIDAAGFIECDVDERLQTLPSTFRGMSGGPVFTVHRELIGINKGETRAVAPGVDGHLYATRRAAWTDLHTPFTLPDDAPTDYTRQRACLEMPVRHKSSGMTTRAEFLAEFYWSPSNPSHRYGEFGRIVGARLGTTDTQRRYRINVESVFFLPVEHDDESRYQALRTEAVFVMESLGCVPLDE
jgi:hypothetical protein